MQENWDSQKAPRRSNNSRNAASDFPLRVLLYSHDSVGLGHLRRNLAIATRINSTFPRASILILTGSPCATQFKLPPNTDLIKIPSISKDESGQYVPVDRSNSLRDTLALRGEIIFNAFSLFKPTMIIVDHQVTGLKGEALNMLREAKSKGVLTIYGSRDIKDSPEVVTASWRKPQYQWAFKEGYNRVCVYGMQKLFDPREAYAPCMDGAARVEFTGFLVPNLKKASKGTLKRSRKKVLVTFGGGSDGKRRAEAYLKALKLKRVDWDSHIITGPLMDKSMKRKLREMAHLTQPIGAVKVQGFHRNIPGLLQEADAVVSMAGYNSVAEILQSGVPALLLPRSFPRKEQLIRARTLAQRGLVDYLPEEDINPENLLKAVERVLKLPRRSSPGVDMNGLDRLMEIIHDLLSEAGLVTSNSLPNRVQTRIR